MNVAVVFEIIGVSEVDGKEKQVGRGWSILRVFSSDDVIDFNSGKEPKTTRYVTKATKDLLFSGFACKNLCIKLVELMCMPEVLEHYYIWRIP